MTPLWALRGFSRLKVILFLLFIASFSFLFAETDDDFGIGISNFGKVNENYYRGGQPDESDMLALKKLGIKTVIDLRKKGEAEEEGWAGKAGLNFVKIPLSGTRPATAEQTEYFLKLVKDPSNLPVFVHCAGGKHRTGSMTALYRITNDSWTAERAAAEMYQYGFYSFPNHGSHKKYVFEYYENLLQAQKPDDVIPPAVATPVRTEAVSGE